MSLRRLLVDDETGEIIASARADRFVKRMREVWRYVTQIGVFTAAEERLINALADYLQLGTNAIVSPDGEYMAVEDMARRTGFDRANTRKYIKSLIRKNALGKWVSGSKEAYYINPHLYQCGDVKPYLFAMFDDEVGDSKRVVAGKRRTSIVHIADFRARDKKIKSQ